EPVQCRWGDIQLLLNSGAEFKELGENLHLEEIREALQFEERCHTALFLCLAVWDEHLTDSARDRAIATAEKLLKDYQVAAFVMNRLLSRPMPHGLLGGVSTFLTKTSRLGSKLDFIYFEVFEAQPAIRVVSDIWDE